MQDPKDTKETLVKAAQVGLQICSELVSSYPKKADLIGKYRILIQGLTKNKDLKTHLVNGILSPAKFVKMKEMELASDDFIKQLKEKEAY